MALSKIQLQIFEIAEIKEEQAKAVEEALGPAHTAEWAKRCLDGPPAGQLLPQDPNRVTCRMCWYMHIAELRGWKLTEEERANAVEGVSTPSGTV